MNADDFSDLLADIERSDLSLESKRLLIGLLETRQAAYEGRRRSALARTTERSERRWNVTLAAYAQLIQERPGISERNLTALVRHRAGFSLAKDCPNWKAPPKPPSRQYVAKVAAYYKSIVTFGTESASNQRYASRTCSTTTVSS